MAPVLHKIASKRNLKAVWDQSGDSKSPKKACGLDHERTDQFALKLTDRINEINKSLLEGTYEFGPLRAIAFAKPSSSKYRIICVPRVKDRLVQRAIAGYLLNDKADKLRVKNVASHGFIKNRSVFSAVKDAERLRQRMPWALKSDILSFFDVIDRSMILDRLQRIVRSKGIFNLLEQVVNCEIGETDPDTRRKIREGSKIQKGRGLRQGMPLSPVLSNFFLSEFDQYFISRKSNLLRYADDFIIFAESEEECRASYNVCCEVLERLDLHIPDIDVGGKTQIYAPDDPAEFLGYEIAPSQNGMYRVMVPKVAFRELSSKITSFADSIVSGGKFSNIDAALNRLTRMIDGYTNAYGAAENKGSLDNHLKLLRVRCRVTVYESIFGKEAVEALSVEKRNFILI